MQRPLRILGWPAYSNRFHNPFNFLMSQALERADCGVIEFSYRALFQEPFDVLHVHWPDGFINEKSVLTRLRRMAILSLIVFWVRFKGRKIVWTVHNLLPHDAVAPQEAFSFLRWFSHRCDGLVFLSNDGRRLFEDFYGDVPGGKSRVIPHGHYKDLYSSRVSQEQARVRLGIPLGKKVFLFFGKIKGYKNLEGLISAYKNIHNRDHLALVVAGGPETPEQESRIRKLVGESQDIFLHLAPVADQDIPLYFGAADITVLPYRKILNSGAGILSLSLGRPVLVPAIGSMPEMASDVGGQAVFLYDGDIRADVLLNVVGKLEAVPVSKTAGKEIPVNLDRYDWQRIAQDLRGFYLSLFSPEFSVDISGPKNPKI